MRKRDGSKSRVGGWAGEVSLRGRLVLWYCGRWLLGNYITGALMIDIIETRKREEGFEIDR